jgi:hypothetical protein
MASKGAGSKKTTPLVAMVSQTSATATVSAGMRILTRGTG